MDLREQLDNSFGTGPEHRELDELLTSGRRAATRRTRKVAVFGVGALAVTLGLGAWAAPRLGGDEPAQLPAASDPQATASAPVNTSPTGEAAPETCGVVTRREIASYFGEELCINPDIKVLKRTDGLVPGMEQSAAMLVRTPQGKERYFFISANDSGGMQQAYGSAEFDGTFDEFVEFNTPLMVLGHGGPPVVGAEEPAGVEAAKYLAFDGDMLVGRNGARIVKQRADLDSGEFGAEGRAVLGQMQRDGKNYWVAARHMGEEEQFITVSVAKAPEVGSLAEFADFVRKAYESGAGLL